MGPGLGEPQQGRATAGRRSSQIGAVALIASPAGRASTSASTRQQTACCCSSARNACTSARTCARVGVEARRPVAARATSSASVRRCSSSSQIWRSGAVEHVDLAGAGIHDHRLAVQLAPGQPLDPAKCTEAALAHWFIPVTSASSTGINNSEPSRMARLASRPGTGTAAAVARDPPSPGRSPGLRCPSSNVSMWPSESPWRRCAQPRRWASGPAPGGRSACRCSGVRPARQYSTTSPGRTSRLLDRLDEQRIARAQPGAHAAAPGLEGEAAVALDAGPQRGDQLARVAVGRAHGLAPVAGTAARPATRRRSACPGWLAQTEGGHLRAQGDHQGEVALDGVGIALEAHQAFQRAQHRLRRWPAGLTSTDSAVSPGRPCPPAASSAGCPRRAAARRRTACRTCASARRAPVDGHHLVAEHVVGVGTLRARVVLPAPLRPAASTPRSPSRKPQAWNRPPPARGSSTDQITRSSDSSGQAGA